MKTCNGDYLWTPRESSVWHERARDGQTFGSRSTNGAAQAEYIKNDRVIATLPLQLCRSVCPISREDAPRADRRGREERRYEARHQLEDL